MVDDALHDLLDALLRPLGAVSDPGEEFADPPLDVTRLYARPVRLHWLPVVGRALSVVAVARQPADLPFSTEGVRQWLTRVAMAVNGRYPPWRRLRGLSIGLTAIMLTAEPITPNDETILKPALSSLARMRAFPLGIVRLNLGQEAMSFAVSGGPGNLFPEPTALADALTERFRRFVPQLDT